MKKTLLCLSAIAGLCATLALPAAAQTTAKEPWVRGTVAQQKATGAFMQLNSASGGRLVAAASPVAGVVEIHEMKMVGDVMKMSAVPGLDLPAGQTVELKPGGYHVMLMALKQPLKAGDVVPLTLTIEGKDGKKETLELQAPVKALGMPEGMGAGHGGMKH